MNKYYYFVALFILTLTSACTVGRGKHQTTIFR